MNEQTLEMQIKAKSQEALSTVDKLISKLTGLEKAVTSIDDTLKNGTVKTTVSDINNLKSATDKATSSTNKLGNALKNVFTFAGAKRLTMSALGWMNEAIDFTEQLNLFNVVFDNAEKNGKKMFSELGKSATQFQYKLNEAFGTNKTQTLYMQGIFQSMGETVGISDKYSAIMSETMTKLTYDLASLYNKSEKTTAEAIRAGVYAGQTKPLRSYGIDVTQMSMQPILDSLGIDEQVKNMSQAEKEILRYLATLKQSKIAMGDLANTIESPSNQLKVFRQQLVETKVAMSSLFIGTLSNALPYANAFLMVIKEISKAIATMFGIELKDYNSGIASQEDIYDGIADSADDASKAVKELKRQTLGFDEIHNINENNDSGSGTSVSGGIDQRLLDAITGYDNGMNKVRMKATEIRDRIMEWLGFTKEIDPLTGEVSFKLKEGWSRLKAIGGIVATLVGFKIVKSLGNLITGTGKLSKILGTGGLFKNLKNLVEYCKIYTNLAGGNMLKGITGGTKAWITQAGVLTKVGLGLSGLVTSTYFAVDAGRDLAESSENTASKIGQLAISTGGAIASGALLGSTFGPLGTVIGGASGAVISLTSALIGYAKESYNIETSKKVFDDLGISIGAVSDKFVTMFDNSTFWTNSLENLKIGYDNARNTVTNTEDSIRQFIDSLLIQDETITQAQIQTLIDKYDQLSNEIVIANQKSIEYASNYITGLHNMAGVSSTTTAQVIADLSARQSAEEGRSLAYIQKQKELTTQLYNGEITLSQYNQKINELAIYYGDTKSATYDATVELGKFKREISNIDYGNIDELPEKINKVKESHDNTIKSLTDSKEDVRSYWQDFIDEAQGTIDYYEGLMENNRTLTDEQKGWVQQAKDDIIAYRSHMNFELNEVDKKIEEVQGNYKGFLSAIYADLCSDGAQYSSEFSGTIDTIEKDLEKLKDVDMSGFGEEMFNSMLKSVTASESKYLGEIATKFSEYGIKGSDEFYSAVEKNMTDSQKIEKQKNIYANAGFQAPEGYRKGIQNNIDKNGAGGDIIGKSSIEETKDILGIHSPSKVYEGLGENTVQGYINGIKSKKSDLLSEIKGMLNDVKKEFNNVSFGINISTSVESSFNSILSKLETFANKFRNGINNLLYGMTTSMNGVYVGNDNKIYYKSMPYVSVPRFANGGMPEDGLFFANHNELVGKFNNGNTAVANNLQIEKGIEEASYRGYMRAIADSGMNSGQTSEIDVHVHTDEGTVIDRIEQRTKQTGVFPFTIPTY